LGAVFVEIRSRAGTGRPITGATLKLDFPTIGQPWRIATAMGVLAGSIDNESNSEILCRA
jgi:hypothetical protein